MSELEKGTARWASRRFKVLSKLRWKVQVLFLLALNPLWLKSWRVYRVEGMCLPILNCHGCVLAAGTCPIGVIGDMASLGLVPWLAIGMFGFVGALIGRLTCGWACPFGFLQDLAAKIPIPKWDPPRWTRWIKYVVLVGSVVLVASLVGVDTRWFFCRTCPAATLSASIPAAVAGQVGWYAIWPRLAMLAAVLVLIVCVKRGFCRLLCPIGAGLSFFNKISLLSIKYRKDSCSQCMLCIRDCPTGQGPMGDPRDTECVQCARCLRCKSLDMDFSSS